MPKRTDDFRAHQERHILDAARRCFIRLGYDRTTIRTIAAAAGLSTGAVYVYFQTKESILLAICHSQAEQQQTALERTHTAPSTGVRSFAAVFRTALQPFLDVHDDQVRERELLNLLFWYESTRDEQLGAVMQHLTQTWQHAITTQIVAAQEAQQIAADIDPEIIATILIALPFGLQLYDLLRQAPQDRSAWIDTLGKVLDRGMRTPDQHELPSATTEDSG